MTETRRPTWFICAVLAAGLLFAALGMFDEGTPRSPLWGLEWALFLLLLVALSGCLRMSSIPGPGLTCALLAWGFGMVYELSLTVDGSGIGGVHPDTGLSFLYAQGDYVPLCILVAWLCRRFGLRFQQLFHLCGGIALTEALVFTGVLTEVILSPAFWAAPLVLGYYVLAYCSFLATPAMLLPPPTRNPPRIPPPLWWVAGFVLGFGVRLFWGLVYVPAVDALFGLPAM